MRSSCSVTPPRLRQLLGSVLRHSFYRVTPIGDGRNVFQHVADADFDLPFLDLLLLVKCSEAARIVGLEL
ncbi:MAG: hypothetical protein JNM89_08335 [Hyphomicrobiaceae bacterium]|nr:hypothetical protein [Hyphomicrobiaceae bacterium]